MNFNTNTSPKSIKFLHGDIRTKFLILSLASISSSVQFSHSVMSDSVTPGNAACQASLSITNSQSILKLMSVELLIHRTFSSSIVPFSSSLQSFPASVSFQMSQSSHQVVKVLEFQLQHQSFK